jgi:tetratricopeptide (TPR) repeat protein
MMEVWQTWRRKTARTGWLAIVWLSLVAAGCTNLNEARQNIARNQAPDVGPIREKRTEELARDFDRNRDNAQFEAAASCWQRGDVEGSKTMLIQLLQRNPNYRRARFVLADIYLFNGDSKLAIDQLRQVVESNSNDPMAHYALAQVLDATGQRSEALEHYSKAMQLDPKNEVYSLSYNTAQAASRSEAVLANTSPPVAAPLKPVQAKRAAGLTLTERPMPPTSTSSAQATSNGKPLQTQSVKLASVDEWVRPIDLGTSSTPNDKPQSESSKNTASVMAVKAAPSSAVPVVAAPVAVRAPEAHAEQRSEEHSANGEPGLATAASYSVVSTNPADRQSLQNPLQRAVDALARGDTEGAIQWATAGLAQSPQQPAPLYRLLGAAHYRRGEYQAAQIALGQALSLDKPDALSYFLMGSTLSKLGQSETAARCFAEAARLDPRFGS